jgi:type IV fimbrial biogenesis protein FimT
VRRGGFTLTELMIALAVVAILAGMASPEFQSMIARQQMRAAVNDLATAIDLTRSLAIARGSVVVLAPADPAGEAWEQGWSVFTDRNGNSRRDPGEELIFEERPAAAGMHIRSAFSSSTGPEYVAYNGAGRGCQSDNSQAARWGTLTLEFGTQRRLIKINMLGRVRVCDPKTQPSCTGAD